MRQIVGGATPWPGGEACCTMVEMTIETHGPHPQIVLTQCDGSAPAPIYLDAEQLYRAVSAAWELVKPLGAGK
jgi:hypothetical protein